MPSKPTTQAALQKCKLACLAFIEMVESSRDGCQISTDPVMRMAREAVAFTNSIPEEQDDDGL